MANDCLYKQNSTNYNEADGITLAFCPPDFLYRLTDAEFEAYANYENYTGVTACIGGIHPSSGGALIPQSSYPCGADKVVVDPLEFMQFHQIETGYTVTVSGSDSYDNIIATLVDLFEFSVEDFAFFNAICLIGFITGHSIGRVLRILGKT